MIYPARESKFESLFFILPTFNFLFTENVWVHYVYEDTHITVTPIHFSTLRGLIFAYAFASIQMESTLCQCIYLGPANCPVPEWLHNSFGRALYSYVVSSPFGAVGQRLLARSYVGETFL